MEFLRDDCLDDVLNNGFDSDDDAFWFWLLFDDGLSDLFCLFEDGDWHLMIVFSISFILFTGPFGIDGIDLCLDSSENIEVSPLAKSFWGRCKEKSLPWGLFTFTEKFHRQNLNNISFGFIFLQKMLN